MLDGIGIGLRYKYIDDLLNNNKIKWLELMADYFIDDDNPVINKVEKLGNSYKFVLHSLNLSLASSTQLNYDYLFKLKKIVQRFKPLWFSDHLCFNIVGNKYIHDLLPFPFKKDILALICDKINIIRDTIGCDFLIENISSYVRFNNNDMDEAEFINEIVSITKCGILLDVNNLFVTSTNHNESITKYLNTIPMNKVTQIHMAGFTSKENFLIDTHSKSVDENVLQIYANIIKKHGYIPTCIEWDQNLPSFDIILKEIDVINAVI